MNQFKNILVAVDGSEESEKALDKAIQITKRNQAKLLIAHVIDRRAFESVTSYDTTLAKTASNDALKTLKRYADKAKQSGVDSVETLVEFGIPKTIIGHDLQEKHQIDLIVLGATGLNNWERLVLGSVSSYVTRHAECDVLIVKNN